VIHSQAVEFCH